MSNVVLKPTRHFVSATLARPVIRVCPAPRHPQAKTPGLSADVIAASGQGGRTRLCCLSFSLAGFTIVWPVGGTGFGHSLACIGLLAQVPTHPQLGGRRSRDAASSLSSQRAERQRDDQMGNRNRRR